MAHRQLCLIPVCRCGRYDRYGGVYRAADSGGPMQKSKPGMAGVFATLCIASFAAGQELAVSSVMQSQVRAAPQHDDGRIPGSDEAAGEGDLQFAAWLQPPAQPGFATSQPTVRRAATASRLASTSLASVPNMFGDLPLSTAIVVVPGIDGQRDIFFSQFSLPLNSAGRSGKLSENDSPIPQDRVFFNYNHFHNVFQLNETPLTTTGATVLRQEPLDRYTLGGEKTFLDGWTSIEVRMPFNGIPDPQLQTVGVEADSIGNLTVVLKALLSMSDTTAVGAGATRSFAWAQPTSAFRTNRPTSCRTSASSGRRAIRAGAGATGCSSPATPRWTSQPAATRSMSSAPAEWPSRRLASSPTRTLAFWTLGPATGFFAIPVPRG
jgi:hypothetical protein